MIVWRVIVIIVSCTVNVYGYMHNFTCATVAPRATRSRLSSSGTTSASVARAPGERGETTKRGVAVESGDRGESRKRGRVYNVRVTECSNYTVVLSQNRTNYYITLSINTGHLYY